MKEGDVYCTNQYGKVEVLSILPSSRVLVRFLNTGSVKDFRKDAILSGQIRDLFSPKTYGVGFIGEGIYKATKTGEHIKHYKCWSGMLERCYSEKYHSKENYKGRVTVCEEWLNYQNFADWFEYNYIEGWQLDKDISKSNTYSPESCHFLPKELNVFFTGRRYYRGENPIGVAHRGKGSYEVYISDGNKMDSKYLGSYKTPEEAFNVYKREKRLLLNNLISKYYDLLPRRTLAVLRNYEFQPFPE